MSLVVSPLAESDLEEIWLFLASEAGHDTADRTIDSIVRAFSMLVAHPHAGRARPDIHDEIRSFPVGKFVVYYRAIHTIEVARILHGSRDPDLAQF